VFRRISRYCFTILAAMSLAVCVAICLLWARSYWEMDEVTAHRGGRHTMLNSSYGQIGLFVAQYPYLLSSRDFTLDIYHPVDLDDRYVMQGSRAKGGFVFTWNPPDAAGNQYRNLLVPHWSLAAAALVLPLVWTRKRWMERARRKPGHCAECGYDLRAHKPGERCPECGAENLSSDV
jgi:hypothetical protein